MIGTPRKATALRAALQLALAAAGTAAHAQAPAVDQLVPARPTGYVTDVAGVIAPEAAARMDDLIARLRAATGAEIAVVTLPTVGDRDASEVALEIGRRWGVGARAEIGDPRRNAGIVVLLVPRQNNQPGTGQIRIEVGQGLEGIVTDAAAGRVRRDVMAPALAQEAYGAGLLAGVQALVSLIARGYGVSDSALTAYKLPPAGGEAVPPIAGLLPLLLPLFVFFVIASARGGRRRRRHVYWGGGPWIGGGWGGGGGFGGGGFGGFGGGGGFSGGGSGGRF